MSEKNKKILIILEDKKKETDRFIVKYKTRKMQDLEEYYKGASWALDYTIKTLQEDEE